MAIKDILIGVAIFSLIITGLGSIVISMTTDFGTTTTYNLTTLSQINSTSSLVDDVSSKLDSGETEDVTVLNTIGLLSTSAFEAVKLYATTPSLIQNIGTDINIVTGGLIPQEVFVIIGIIISIAFITALFKVFTKVDKV